MLQVELLGLLELVGAEQLVGADEAGVVQGQAAEAGVGRSMRPV